MKKLLFILLAFIGMQVSAQNMALYKKVIQESTSSKYQGRGYAKGGANKAGKFLAKEYTRVGVDEVVCQPFTLDIQTFAGKMEMWTNSESENSKFKKLVPGVDFSMREYSPGVYGEFPV